MNRNLMSSEMRESIVRIEAALRRARERALECSRHTHTAVVLVEKGKTAFWHSPSGRWPDNSLEDQ